MAAQNTMPERIGPYRLVEKIGEGGMGVVHLAHDPEGRPVAVKVLRPGVAGDPDARRRLGREFETMRRVRSPFVAAVIDADVTGEVPYVVTRYVAGPSLDQMVAATGPLRGQPLERLAWGLAEGLAAVHAAGVVHRDLKPGNVVIAGGTPVLIDFGIAQAPDATKITQTGMFMGTPGYLAPEVVEGQPSGPAADVHSWGSTVAFAATGRPPFGTGSYETIFYRIVSGQPDLAGIPSRLLPMVTAALARNPVRRPSAARLSQECAALDLSGPDTAGGLGAAALGAAGAAAAGGLGAAAGDGLGAAAAGGLGAAALGGPGTRLDAAVAPGLAAPGLAAPASALASGPAQDAAVQHWAQQMRAARGKDNYADLLTPVSYAPVSAPPGSFAPPGSSVLSTSSAPAAGGASAAAHTGFRRLLTLLTVGIAVAVSVLLPVAGAIASVAAVALLRAADHTHVGLTRRRSAQGARASDIPLMIIKAPWALVRSLFGCLLVAPLALTCGAIAAVVTIMVMHTNPLPDAGAYAAGAFVACYGYGPGSDPPRRELGRLFGPLGRRRLLAVLVPVVLTLLLVATATAAATQPHDVWPLAPSLASHLRLLHRYVLRLQAKLPRL
jgi:hypothetical protein